MSKKLIWYISLFGIGGYLLALITISLLFREYALQLKWMLWGIGEVLFFFAMTAVFYPRWKDNSTKVFLLRVFFVALLVRVAYAVAVGYYYFYETGMSYEYGAADSRWYHGTALLCAQWLKQGDFTSVIRYLRYSTMGFSDQGYPLWLMLVYTVFGRNLLVPRILKGLMSAYLCVLVYKLGKRTFGESTGRLAAVLCVFMPILIQICGIHSKETELIFLSIFALERIDWLFRSKHYTFWNVLVPVLLTSLTFGFRTIVGMCLIFASLVFILLSPNDLVTKRGKIVGVAGVIVVLLVLLFTPVGREMKTIYHVGFSELNYRTESYESMGLKYSGLAKSCYMAPGAFVLPLAPMVEAAPDHNKMIHGGIFVKNFLAFFAMLAIVIAVRQKKWRDFSLVGAYEFSYLALIMFSFAANSERYHEAAIPLLVLMSAYAMTHLRHRDLKLFYVYCGLLFVALLAWNWIKLSARGLV